MFWNLYALVNLDLMADIESLESESDTNGDKNLEKALIWYDKFLGFQVVGGEGNWNLSELISILDWCNSIWHMIFFFARREIYVQ